MIGMTEVKSKHNLLEVDPVNALRSAMCVIRQRWWLFVIGAVAMFVFISGIAWVSYWLAGYFRVLFSSTSSSLLLSSLGFHGHVLVAIATIGMPIAIWRGYALHKQSAAALEQSNTAQKNLLNERYQKGVEMLGSKELSIRFGGIHALERLAGNEPDTYHIPIMAVFSAFVRNWHIKDGQEDEQKNGAANAEKRESPRDVSTILDAIGYRSSEQHDSESGRKYIVDLTEARLHRWEHGLRRRTAPPDFSNVNFLAADLSRALVPRAKFVRSNFEFADLSGAGFIRSDFSNAYFSGADLSGALLSWANLADANFSGAKLAGTDLAGVEGLTQKQLNSASIDPNNPPVLTDAVDPTTEKPLGLS